MGVFRLSVPFLAAILPAQGGELSLHAEVRAAHILTVRSRLDGNVARVPVQRGQRPAALAPLVVISAPDLDAEHGAAKAELYRAEQELEVVAVDERVALVRLGMARRRVQDTEKSLAADQRFFESAVEAHKRVVVQYEAGRVPAADVEVAHLEVLRQQRAFADIEAALLDLRDESAIAELELTRAVAGVVAHRARIDVARAAAESLRVRASFAEIKNVLPGARVSCVLVGQGDLVAPGTALLELVDDRRVTLVVHIPTSLARRVRPGTTVHIREADGAPVDADAEVSRVSGLIDPDTGTMEVEIDLDNAEGTWLPGEVLPVRITVGDGG